MIIVLISLLNWRQNLFNCRHHLRRLEILKPWPFRVLVAQALNAAVWHLQSLERGDRLQQKYH